MQEDFKMWYVNAFSIRLVDQVQYVFTQDLIHSTWKPKGSKKRLLKFICLFYKINRPFLKNLEGGAPRRVKKRALNLSWDSLKMRVQSRPKAGLKQQQLLGRPDRGRPALYLGRATGKCTALILNENICTYSSISHSFFIAFSIKRWLNIRCNILSYLAL